MTEFISKWNVNGTLRLPLIKSGTYDFDVDWGDDTTSHIKSYDNVSHRYTNSGIYLIRITGTIKGWKAEDTNEYQLLDICQWGCLMLGNKGFYFQGCNNLQITAIDSPDLSETRDLTRMFSNCTRFNSPIGHWNVSNITKMDHMFCYARLFNQPLNTWDVSKVTDMCFMFQFASSFNQPLDLWNVSNIRYIGYMFHYAIAFNQDISSWNVSNVIYMSYFLKEATCFNYTNRTKLLKWNSLLLSYVADHMYELNMGLNNFLPPPNLLMEWTEFKAIHIDSNEIYDCAICMTEISNKDDWRAFRCESTMKQLIAHCFHNECIEIWVKSNKTCPCCRGKPIIEN